MRYVFDTNILISALLISNSLPAQALKKAENSGTILYSADVLQEIKEVLFRPKFLSYISGDEVVGFLARIVRSWEEISIIQRVDVCRDSKDNKFLELALNGDADFLITGDNDLLVLNSYRSTKIIGIAPNSTMARCK